MSRTLWPLAALAMLAVISVISAGCGLNTPAKSGTGSSGGGNTTAATAATTATTTAAETGTRSSGGNTTTTAAATASAGGSASTGQTRQQSTGQQLSPAQKQAWLSWAKCIRAHGVPNFADPTFPADVPGAIALSGAFSRASGPRGRAPVANSPQLRSAIDACEMPSTRGIGG